MQSAWSGSFCAAHENQFENKCRVRECTNDRLPVSQACELHKPEWDRYVYQHSRQKIKQKLQRPAENLEWNPAIIENIQPHDQETPEVARKHYFGPA